MNWLTVLFVGLQIACEQAYSFLRAGDESEKVALTKGLVVSGKATE